MTTACGWEPTAPGSAATRGWNRCVPLLYRTSLLTGQVERNQTRSTPQSWQQRTETNIKQSVEARCKAEELRGKVENQVIIQQ